MAAISDFRFYTLSLSNTKTSEMKNTLLLFLFFCSSLAIAQTKLELTPNGFSSLKINSPAKPLEKLMDAAKTWADTYNSKNGADAYDVTSNSLKIDALKDNAFFFRNLGETYSFKIRYTLSVEFGDRTYKLTFRVKEILDSDEKLLNTTIADYFTSEGKLKEDYEEVKLSLENTANAIVNSFATYIAR